MKKKWFRRLPALLLALALVALLLPGSTASAAWENFFYTGILSGKGTITISWNSNSITYNQDAEQNGYGHMASYGTQVTVTAEPADGYQFVAWVDPRGEEGYGTTEYYRTLSTETTVTYNVAHTEDTPEYFALFAKQTDRTWLIINVLCEGENCGGTFSVNRSSYMAQYTFSDVKNSKKTVTAKADEGYEFVGWKTLNDGIVSKSSTYSFTLSDTLLLWAVFEKTSTPGDVNGDGNIDSDDAMQVLKYYVGSISASDLKLEAADVNGDNTVDSDDAMLILKYYVGSITQFPVT